MEIGNKVVAKFIDGRVIKGQTSDFYKSRPIFHVVPQGEKKAVNVEMPELKALFFVKTFEGRKHQIRKLKHVPYQVYGRKAKICFEDGEEIEGFVQAFNPDEKVFLLVPDNPTSNNLRIFCNREAVAKIIWLAKEEKTAKKFKTEDYL